MKHRARSIEFTFQSGLVALPKTVFLKPVSIPTSGEWNRLYCILYYPLALSCVQTLLSPLPGLVHLFYHSFNKYLLSIFYMLGIVDVRF